MFVSVCKKCGSETKQGDIFCGNCGSNLENVCNNCGSYYNDEDIFCQTCGHRIVENIDACASPEKGQKWYQKKYLWLVATLLILLIAGAVGAHYYFNNNKLYKANSREVVKMNSASTAIKQNNSGLDEKNEKEVFGVIQGNDVIVRSEASTAGAVIDYLPTGIKVRVLSKKKCEDQNAAVINVQGYLVRLDGKDINLNKGQAVKIISFDGNNYKCETEISKRRVYIYPKQQQIRKIYGEVWYQVQINNIKIGWVFGDYIRTQTS